MAIEAQGLEIQIGARTLLHPTNFHVAKGDKIGLVGRNGAGKTTLTRVITGDMLPTAGKVRVSGKLGYLPQDTHASDPTQTALDRMMSARDIASIIKRIRKAEKEMTDPDPDVMTKAMNRYDKAMQDFEKAGGYAAQSEATAMAASLGLPQDVMGQQLGTLSGGQRRRIELARILAAIEQNKLDSALQQTEALLKQYPNFRLAHLIKGDLLLARGKPLATFGNAKNAPEEKLTDLREEAVARLKAYRDRPSDAGYVPRYLLQMQSDQKHAIVIDTQKFSRRTAAPATVKVAGGVIADRKSVV